MTKHSRSAGKQEIKIVFVAAIAKVQTLVDGGIRVYVDLPETDTLAAAQLMEMKRHGIAAQIEVIPIRGKRGKKEKIVEISAVDDWSIMPEDWD